MTFRRPGRVCVIVLVSSFAIVACEGSKKKPTYPTEGTLLFNGQPAANITVFFNPVNSTDPQPTRAYATTNTEGVFSLTTYDAHDGAPEGEYIVTLLYEPLTSPLSRPKTKPPTFDKKYSDPANSPLRATIAKKPKNQLDPFDVK